jgi:hypothetical protein
VDVLQELPPPHRATATLAGTPLAQGMAVASPPSLATPAHPAMRTGIARLWRGVWRVADPRVTLASVASMALGTAAAAREGPISWDGWR